MNDAGIPANRAGTAEERWRQWHSTDVLSTEGAKIASSAIASGGSNEGMDIHATGVGLAEEWRRQRHSTDASTSMGAKIVSLVLTLGGSGEEQVDNEESKGGSSAHMLEVFAICNGIPVYIGGKRSVVAADSCQEVGTLHQADHLAELAREAHYELLRRTRPICYRPTSSNATTKIHPVARPSSYNIVISILASRANLVKLSLETWMPYLPRRAKVVLSMDDRIYTSGKEEWDKIPLHINTYTTSEQKDSYSRAAEVFLASYQTAVSSNLDADWFLAVDDDSFVDPIAVQSFLSTRDPSLPLAMGKAICYPFCGGEGLFMSRAALQVLDASTDCLKPCDTDMKFGDVALGVSLGGGGNIENTIEPLALESDHAGVHHPVRDNASFHRLLEQVTSHSSARAWQPGGWSKDRTVVC